MTGEMQSLPIPNVSSLILEATAVEHGDLALPKRFKANEIKPTNRCSRPLQREGKPAYVNIIVEAFQRDQNSGSHQLVCQEIADRGKKLVYTQDTPQVKVLCALMDRKTYSLDKKVKNLHSDYYEFACGTNYLIVTK